ncbi:MAG: RNA polymerase sigma factor [Propionicimonas sp.]
MAIGDRFPQVLSAASEGAEWAWAELYRDLAPVLLRFLIGQGVAEPEDCLGECFVQLVRNLPSFTGDERAFRAWAFRVARNRVVDTWRAADRRPVSTTGDVPAVLDRRFQHEAADGDVLRRDWLAQVLAGLTPDQRTVVLLRVLDQFSVEETAQIVGKSPGAVRVLQSRAIKSLRIALGPTNQ